MCIYGRDGQPHRLTRAARATLTSSPRNRQRNRWFESGSLQRRYQELIMMLRQSRASLSARSWAFCSHAERPSIGPELRSERRLCERLTSIWLTAGLVDWGLEDPVPDYSTFPTARSRERSVRRLFEGVAVRCERPGLVSGEGFVIASVIEADASRGRKVDGKAHDVAGSGKEHARSRLRRQAQSA